MITLMILTLRYQDHLIYKMSSLDHNADCAEWASDPFSLAYYSQYFTSEAHKSWREKSNSAARKTSLASNEGLTKLTSSQKAEISNLKPIKQTFPM